MSDLPSVDQYALSDTLLGKQVSYNEIYSPQLLSVLPRQGERQGFNGWDIWHAYEISWLNQKGKPEIAVGRFVIPCDSEGLIESKSFKLYLNSFNQTVFKSADIVSDILRQDLSQSLNVDVLVDLISGHDFVQQKEVVSVAALGLCLDDEDIAVDVYQPDKKLLLLGSVGLKTEEVLYSNLLKSNCPVTGQPDWATLIVSYEGKKIDHASLLRYICSYRLHSGFHEQCVEQIFNDIFQQCQPDQLSVEACYTRRGGLDINPFRTTLVLKPELAMQASAKRFFRQ